MRLDDDINEPVETLVTSSRCI